MNKTLPLIAVAALAFAVLSTETAQAQQFGNGVLSSNGNQQINGATLGPTIPRFVDFGTVFGNAQSRDVQHRGFAGVAKVASTGRWSPIAINEYGTLGDSSPTRPMTPNFQRKYVRNQLGTQTA